MKKLFGVFILGLLMFSMLASFVSAGAVAESVKKGMTSAYDVVKPALEFVTGENSDSPELFLAKILLVIIIFSIVWMALNKISFFSENEWSLWTVAIAISLLSIRWIGNASVVNTIILPYSALGVALTAGLPFVIYFLVVKDFNRTMRKLSWAFFIVIFVALWIMRSGDKAVEAGSIGGAIGPFAWIYLATAGLGLAVLLFDKTIQRIINKINIEGQMSYKDLERKHRLLDDLDEARDLKSKLISRGETAAKIKNAQTHMDRLEKEIAKLP
ncbi:MAG: hypothetical protein KKF50_01490 [Nanoarchaeota archaeon]|nr:hypothetical protein [Nanoarchaeota archaeon]